MKPEDLLDRLMKLEAEATEAGLSTDDMLSAYYLRCSALEEEDRNDGDEDDSD